MSGNVLANGYCRSAERLGSNPRSALHAGINCGRGHRWNNHRYTDYHAASDIQIRKRDGVVDSSVIFRLDQVTVPEANSVHRDVAIQHDYGGTMQLAIDKCLSVNRLIEGTFEYLKMYSLLRKHVV